MATADSTLPPSLHPSLLILILDIHPLSWSLLSTLSPVVDPSGSTNTLITRVATSAITLSDFVTVLMVFLNAHLASRWGNRVVVFAASAGRSRLLYPTADGPELESGDGSIARRRANAYEPFALLDRSLEVGLKAVIQGEEEKFREDSTAMLNDPPAIVSAMSKALCYINRHVPAQISESSTSASETRILVINATRGAGSAETANGAEADGDHTMNGDANGSAAPAARSSGGNQGTGMRGGYVGLMNCVFAAQKAKVPIDVLTLPPPSTGTAPPIFLQQASHLTEGIYWRWNGRGGLLQYLTTIYLIPPSLRQTTFSNPPQDAVDFRAVCFCHHDVVDVGFVCSVCLSIFCKPLPVCLMCKTKFPIKSLPHLKSLAANLIPIPVPDTIPPPPPPKDKDREKEKRKRKADEVIIVE